MTWEHLQDHDCRTPSPEAVLAIGAQGGSVWRCDVEGCGRSWILVRHEDGRIRFDSYWRPTGHLGR